MNSRDENVYFVGFVIYNFGFIDRSGVDLKALN